MDDTVSYFSGVVYSVGPFALCISLIKIFHFYTEPNHFPAIVLISEQLVGKLNNMIGMVYLTRYVGVAGGTAPPHVVKILSQLNTCLLTDDKFPHTGM